MLTKKQKQILDFITDYIKEKGYSPTFESTKRKFKLSSFATVHQHIGTLKEKGFLDKNSRSIKLAKKNAVQRLVSIPFLGLISAGQPIEAIENRETIAVPQNKLPRSGEFYALRVVGNSMINEKINDGDIILVKHQETADNGQKVVALINNCDATLKKFYKEEGYIRLQPANKNMEPIIIKKDREIAIRGVVLDVIKGEEELQAEKIITEGNIKRNAKLPTNQILCGDAVKILKKFPDNSIDLVATSPPYDAIRKYNGFSFDLHATGKEIHRVLKEGGIAVMVIQDQTKNFGKTLTSFKAIVDWVDNIGFKLFETVIYRKYGAEGAWWNKRFRVDHEYVPIFLKGERPQYFNKEPLKIPSKHGGKTLTGGGTRLTNGVRIATRPITINPTKCRGTIWEYMTAGDGTRLKHKHPATFPDKLPYDFIQCFCPPDGIVLDPFVGSGTTSLAAIELNRKYIGIDISKEYCELAKQRIREESQQTGKLFK